ncbi:H-NS family nucleoid-associated regulatory protein [Roseateles sp. MS654]|uniref:H-NS histone family protein n=1 Tax=Roseateles sp. MS654 TaxID=3412685 RepID=UPI003C2CEBDF
MAQAMQRDPVDPSAPKQSKSTGAAPVMYRDPANPENTWSGRGRAAQWLADYEAQGRKRDEFKV